MTRTRRLSLLCCVGAFGVPHAAAAQGVPPALMTDAEVREFLRDRVDLQHKAVGMVVGITTPAGHRVVAYGSARADSAQTLDGDTEFEIGSFTKNFTALLLADMVERKEVTLADPVSKYLPAELTVPQMNGKAATLADLATNTSGLPFAPADLMVTDPASYAHYTDAQLAIYLRSARLDHEPATTWAYSNLGNSLLARALAARAGRNLDTLVRERILTPLGLTHTATRLPPPLAARLATGYDHKLSAAPMWNSPAFPGMGDLKSSTNDLLALLDAYIGRRKSNGSLQAAMPAMLLTRRPAPGFEQALGWWVIKIGAEDPGVALFGGETWGFHSVVAYDPKTQIGVVVLSNAPDDDGGLALHFLRPAMPLQTSASVRATAQRKEVALGAEVLDAYAGRYLGANAADTIVIRHSGDALTMQSNTSPQPLRLHALNEKTFFIVEAEVQISFVRDPAAGVSGLGIQVGGVDYPARRLPDRP